MSAGPIAAVAAVAAALLMSVTARAGEFVQFRSGDTLLTGYTARPAGSGPFPAVVLLHGCGGYHATMMSWTDRLAASGYVALSVDSFGSRGIAVNCGGFAEQPSDAFAALEFLAGKQFVRADAVAVMGFSMEEARPWPPSSRSRSAASIRGSSAPASPSILLVRDRRA